MPDQPTETPRPQTFLSAGEEWLFREVELLHKIHAEIRDTHLKYQSWFMLAQSVLFAAVVNLLVASRFRDRQALFALVCAVGLALGVCAWILQLRHMLDSDSRMRRIREISVTLRRPVVGCSDTVMHFMSYIAGDVRGARHWNHFAYSRIRLVVDAIFPLLWLSMLTFDVG